MDKKISLDFNNIDLSGPDGNAYALMAIFTRQARKEKWTEEEIKKVMKEAMESDYKHLVSTLKKHCY